jgi:hypothetical protein
MAKPTANMFDVLCLISRGGYAWSGCRNRAETVGRDGTLDALVRHGMIRRSKRFPRVFLLTPKGKKAIQVPAAFFRVSFKHPLKRSFER